MLLWLQARCPCCLLAEMDETPNLEAELGQGLIFIEG